MVGDDLYQHYKPHSSEANMEAETYRAVGYKRVSAREQLEGHSLDAQEVHISSYVQAQGWRLLQVYTDAGISAKKDSQRPALEQLLRDAREGKFDVVVVDKIDRFYRHLGSLLSALDQLNSAGVSFASVQEKLDFTTPWGKLMLTVLGMLAEIYLDNLRQETKKGYRQRAHKGLWLGGIPLGYCKGLCADCEDPNGKGYCPKYGGKNRGDGKHLIAHPIESVAVKLAFEWYVSGEYSDTKIAQKLNQIHFRLEDGTEVPFRQKGRKGATEPGIFGRDIIRDLILREAYTGKLPYTGCDAEGRHRHRKPPLEVLDGGHPVIIPPELFEKAQMVRKAAYKNPRLKRGKVCRVFPLTGVLKCGYCGGNMRGESNYERRYYGDGGRIDRVADCSQKLINADLAEKQIIEFVKAVIKNSEGKEDLGILPKRIQVAEERMERARELYLTGEISRSAFEEERVRIETLKKDLHFDTIGATMTSLGVIRAEVPRWNELSNIEQKRLLHLILEAAWVRENAVVGVQPSIAFLSILSIGQHGNMGEHPHPPRLDRSTAPCDPSH
jgi:site-specific DNA recombinase